MKNDNVEWESKIHLNGHTYGNGSNGGDASEENKSDGENEASKNDIGRKPEDPESKGITEGDKGANPGSQDGNRGTGRK